MKIRSTFFFFKYLFFLFLKVEEEKYQKGIDWLKDLLYNTKFSTERLKIVGQKMANSIASMKRSGSRIVRTVFVDLVYNKGKNYNTYSETPF